MIRDETTGSEPGRRDSSTKRKILTWALVIAAPAICSGIVVGWLLAAAHTDMGVPVVYERDALYELAIFKGIGEGNLPWRNSHLAAPFGGSDWLDYPLYQWIDYGAFRFFSLFTNNYLKLLNLYWVLTIMVTAAVAAYCFLQLRVSPVLSGCLAFLYAMQPYVFVRNISHFNLLCYLVPLMATACLEVATGRWENRKVSSFGQIPMHGWVAFVLQGISFFYFSFFGALLLFVAALYGGCRRRTVRPLVHSAFLIAALGCASAVAFSPTLLHWLMHGTNPSAVQRSAAEAEVYGLRIRHLLTPVRDHPLAFMRKLSDIAQAEHPDDSTEASNTRLGLLGTIGFVALLAYIFALLAGWWFPLDDGIITACAMLLLAAILWCTVGGFGSVFNTFVSPILRGYDRIIVFIVFFILEAYGSATSAFLASKPWARAHRVAVATILVCITGIAFADVLWIPHGIQSSEARQTAASDHAFVSAIEQTLGGQGMVFQLPYTGYPDGGGPGKILPFDHARPYLQSSANLQWSWGTMVGREDAQWTRGVAHLPPGSLVWQIEKKGFRGLWIDTYGYADNPSRSPAKAIATILGQEPMASSDGRYLFFNLASAHALAATHPDSSSSAPVSQENIRQGGTCYVDSINDAEVTPPSTLVRRDIVFQADGWMADTDTGVALPDVYLEISGAGGKRLYMQGERYARPDVVNQFKKPSLLLSGFSVSGDVSALEPGSYQIRILQVRPGEADACSAGFSLELR